MALLLLPAVVVFGMYVVTHGQLTPGGGFQGGVILATAPLFLYLAGEFGEFRKAVPRTLVHIAEAVGGGGYAAIGIACLGAGRAFLQNVLPLGSKGTILSGGTIPADQCQRGTGSDWRIGVGPDGVSRGDARAQGRMSYLPYAVAAWLFLVGLYGIITSRNMVHLVICLAVLQSPLMFFCWRSAIEPVPRLRYSPTFQWVRPQWTRLCRR